MTGEARRSSAWRIQEVSDRRPAHCWVAEGGWRVVWDFGIDLASAFKSAGVQRGRQVKHAAVSRHLGCPDFVEVVLGQAHFVA